MIYILSCPTKGCAQLLTNGLNKEYGPGFELRKREQDFIVEFRNDDNFHPVMREIFKAYALGYKFSYAN